MVKISLPEYCHVAYHPNLLTKAESDELYGLLVKEYDFTPLKLYEENGETIYSDFLKRMFLTEELYNKEVLPAEKWGSSSVDPPILVHIKKRIKTLTGWPLDVAVGILYPDGQTGVDFHSDYSAFGDTSMIASLSLGAERMFQLRHKATGKVHKYVLEHGSVFIMGENCQEEYEHALPPDPDCVDVRINLTFRCYGYPVENINI